MNYHLYEDVTSKYEMDEMESLAYKYCLMWIDGVKKYFPDESTIGLSMIPKYITKNKSDPRKSLLFKYCYKFTRESANLLEPDEIPLYICAQLQVLKHLANSGTLPEISAGCLVGDKAWVRWKLWKRKYDSISQKPADVSQITHPGIAKALDGLLQTKEFITKNFGANPSIEKYQEAKLNNNFYRWVNLGKISPYYLVISPFVKAIFTEDDLKRFNFDLGVYKPCITDAVILKFKELFPYEN